MALNDEAYAASRELAAQEGISQAAWVAEAIRQRKLRDGARSYAAIMANLDVQQQLAGWPTGGNDWPPYEQPGTAVA